MADVFSKAKRSAVMARIRSRGNERTELALVRVFRAQHITGWRRHISLSLGGTGSKVPIPGTAARRGARSAKRVRPDFVFRRLRVAVFVDGCFWHGCPQHATKPKTNVAFWRRKFAANQARDRLVTRRLRRAGWRVLRIWEHDLKEKHEARLRTRLERFFGN